LNNLARAWFPLPVPSQTVPAKLFRPNCSGLAGSFAGVSETSNSQFPDELRIKPLIFGEI
jgi:hypothetical protein